MGAIFKPWRNLGWVGLMLCVVATLPAAPASGPWHHNFRQAEAEAKQLDRPLLIHFHASWCGPCHAMEAEVLNSPDLKAALGERVVGVKVDFDKHGDLAERFGVNVLPYDLIISPAGKILSRHSGYQTRQDYLSTLAHHERKYSESRKSLLATTVDPKPKTQPDVIASQTLLPTAPSASQSLGLDGYCPVTLWRTREWKKGTPSLTSAYQELKFQFATPEDQADFEKNPLQYVPQLLGCDPVLLTETDRAFSGSAKYAAYYDGHLYLFTSASSRAKFRERPPEFTQIRHVKLEDIQREDTRLGMKN